MRSEVFGHFRVAVNALLIEFITTFWPLPHGMERSSPSKGQATACIQSVRLRRPSRDAVWSMSSASGSSPPSGVREVNRITHPILHSSYPTEGREYPEAPTDEHFSIVKEEHSVQLEQRSRERSRECVSATAQFLSASLTHHLSL